MNWILNSNKTFAQVNPTLGGHFGIWRLQNDCFLIPLAQTATNSPHRHQTITMRPVLLSVPNCKRTMHPYQSNFDLGHMRSISFPRCRKKGRERSFLSFERSRPEKADEVTEKDFASGGLLAPVADPKGATKRFESGVGLLQGLEAK